MKKLRVIAELLPSILIGLFLFVSVQTQPVWFNVKWSLWLISLGIPLAILYVVWYKKGANKRYSVNNLTPLLIILFFLLLSLISSFPLHSWFYFLRWYPSEAVLWHKSESVRVVVMTLLLTPFFVLWRKKPQLILLAIFIILQFFSFYELVNESGGSALYRTDHPSFMFRLFEFTRSFPQLINFSPYWNGGTEHFVSVTSGTAAPGLLAYPLLRFMQVHEVYTFVVGLLFIIFVPWIAFVSLRAVGGDRVAASAAGLLALGVSQQYFLWMMHYGTIGSALAGSMILPLSAFTFRVVRLNKCDVWTGVALVLSAFFLLLWPPGAIMGAAVAVAFVLNFRYWTWRKWKFLLICGGAVLLMYSHWIWVQVFECESVMKYVLEPKDAPTSNVSWLNATTLKNGWSILVSLIHEGHPILIFFGLAGVLTASRRSIRWWFAPVIIVLALVAGWGEAWKHNSQLSRLSIPMFFVAVIPASMLIGRVLRVKDMRFALVRALLVSLLALGAYNVSRIYANQGNARYVVLDKEVMQLVDWIKINTPVEGRILFAGKCVHAYGSGNVAYLPVLTGREMMADDYYGFPVGTIEYEYPPRRFRKSWKLMQLFFDAYNVTHIVTYHDKWRDYFASHPDYFKEEYSYQSYGRTFSCYSLKRESTMFMHGAGAISARFNHIDVKLSDVGVDGVVVLKYNWIEHLKVSDGVELFPYEVDRDITLIGVRPKGVREFKITYRNIY